MKTKITILLLAFCHILSAQNLGQFYEVRDYEIIEKKEVTYRESEEMGQVVFFYTKYNKIFFCNAQIRKNTRSFGEVKKLKITEDKNKRIYTFDWHYVNNYDNKTGVAKVKFVKWKDQFKDRIDVKIKVPQKKLWRKPYYIFIEASSNPLSEMSDHAKA